VDELRGHVPPGTTMAQWALRWILMFDAVTCAIPGARRPAQVEDNARGADLPALTDAEMAAVQKIYETRIQPLVHHRW
jgi:aryl-alcohol dehydrogenase-like predicted oxidoreductase